MCAYVYMTMCICAYICVYKYIIFKHTYVYVYTLRQSKIQCKQNTRQKPNFIWNKCVINHMCITST